MFFSWSLPLKVKKILGFFRQWYAKDCILEIQDCKPLGTARDFSQDYTGIGYCGMEGDYSSIYDLPGQLEDFKWETRRVPKG